jgi:hypothetical protein
MSFSFCHILDLQAQENEVEAIIQDYFSYLKNGDIVGISSLVTYPLYGERKRLLTENSEYPEFLREFYRNASMEIKSIRATKQGRRAVDVEIYFSDQGPPLETTFVLKKIQNSWKISEEIP